MLEQLRPKLFSYRSGIVVLLLLAAWLYWRAPLDVPPGLEMDELIEAQIAEQIIQGEFRPFYEAGQGREGLYYYWLAGWLVVLGNHVFTLRMASTTLSLLGLAASFQLVRQLFGSRVALFALAFGVTSFWTLFGARSGLRSTALPLLAALSGACFWRGLFLLRVRQTQISREIKGGLLLALSGLFLGLSFYAYTAARVLPAIFLVILLFLFLFHRSRLSGTGTWLLLWSIVVLTLVIPFWQYLQAHPEIDQFAFMDFNRPLAALELGDPEPALRTSLATLGMFNFRGDPLIFDNVPGRPVFSLGVGILFLAGLGLAIWRWRRPAYSFALIWLAVGLLPGMLSQPAPNFYRTVAAQVVAPIFPALALVTAARGVRARSVTVLPTQLIMGMGIFLAVIQLVGTWQAYFNRWPDVEGVSFFWQEGLAETAQFLDASSGSHDVALCTVLVYEYDAWWRPAWQSIPYLSWQAQEDVRYYDCRAAFVRPDVTASYYAFMEPPVSSMFLPARLEGYWQDQAQPLAKAIPAEMGVVFQLERPTEQVTQSPGAYPVWLSPEAGGAAADLPLRFGDSLLLQGYYYDTEALQVGQPLHLVTEWKVLAPPPAKLALFTHLLSDPQTVVAQQDGLYLTSHSLQPGDQFWVLHDQVSVPAETNESMYLLSIGLYSQETMIRLPIYEGEQSHGDRLFLQPIHVSQ